MSMTNGNFPGGLIAHGFMVAGSPVFTTGNIYYLSSTAPLSVDAVSAGTRDRPFATLDYAIGRCTANAGDVIVAMPGHSEDVSSSAQVTFDVAGITLIGLGTGSSRPTFNITSTSGRIALDAANTVISNILVTGGVDATTNPIQVRAADCALLNFETRDVTGQSTDFIVTTASASRLRISGWTHRGAAAAGADTALSIVGGDGITVEDFWIDGNFAVACIENVTTAATNLTIGGGTRMNYARTRNAADVIVTLVSTATASIGPNIFARLQDDAANITEAFVGADAQFFQPIAIVNADGESSLNTNITASVDEA